MTVEEFVRAVTEARGPSSRDLARNAILPDEEWIKLINMGHDYARLAVLSRTVSPKILALLAMSDDFAIRTLAIGSRRFPVEELVRLCSHPDEDIRKRLVRHPKLPLSSLKLLAMDSSEWVAKHAREQLETRQAKERNSKA